MDGARRQTRGESTSHPTSHPTPQLCPSRVHVPQAKSKPDLTPCLAPVPDADTSGCCCCLWGKVDILVAPPEGRLRSFIRRARSELPRRAAVLGAGALLLETSLLAQASVRAVPSSVVVEGRHRCFLPRLRLALCMGRIPPRAGERWHLRYRETQSRHVVGDHRRVFVIAQDFQYEWFIPDDAPLQKSRELSDEYSGGGQVVYGVTEGTPGQCSPTSASLAAKAARATLLFSPRHLTVT